MEPRLDLRRSPIAGTGCYALEPIPEGTSIGEYTGEIITEEEADRRYDGREETYLFSIDGGRCIDATRADHNMKYVNHSCDPTCQAPRGES